MLIKQRDIQGVTMSNWKIGLIVLAMLPSTFALAGNAMDLNRMPLASDALTITQAKVWELGFLLNKNIDRSVGNVTIKNVQAENVGTLTPSYLQGDETVQYRVLVTFLDENGEELSTEITNQ